ncbi:MAG TPA: hypothetical protein VFF70_05770, partial [Anaerolineae bacterium]|nr:hypothetical protein [Anaerolineae bacterium]
MSFRIARSAVRNLYLDGHTRLIDIEIPRYARNDMMDMIDLIQKAAELIARARHAVALTGAGIS